MTDKRLSGKPENAEYFIGRLAMYNADPETVHAVMRIIDSLRDELATAKAVCEAAEAMRDVSIDLRTALGLERKVHEALDAWSKAKEGKP